MRRGDMVVDPNGRVGMVAANGFAMLPVIVQYGSDGPYKEWPQARMLQRATEDDLIAEGLEGVGHSGNLRRTKC